MPSQKQNFLKKNQGPPVRFPAYQPETPFISLEDFNMQFQQENSKPEENQPKISTTQNSTSTTNEPYPQPSVADQPENSSPEIPERTTEDAQPPLVEKDTNADQHQNDNVQLGLENVPSFSDKVKQTINCNRRQRILRKKVVPPFRKEHFMNRQILEADVNASIREILCIFQPKFRPMVTISRTNLTQNNRNIQILMVTAPEEAEEDLARAKLNGIQIMGKTVFPTGEEFWRYLPSEFPKRALLRINNLPILCTDDELEELMELPTDIELAGDLLRESEETDLGRLFTGRAKIPIIIPTKEHEDLVKKWSIIKNSEKISIWNEVPIYMSVASLHKCRLCEQEGRRQVIGHDEKWCRILRNPIRNVISDPENDQPDHQLCVQNESAETNVNEKEVEDVNKADPEGREEVKVAVENEDNSKETDAVDEGFSNSEESAQNNEEDWSKPAQKKKFNKKKRKRTDLSTTTSGSKSTTNSPKKGPEAKHGNFTSNG